MLTDSAPLLLELALAYFAAELRFVLLVIRATTTALRIFGQRLRLLAELYFILLVVRATTIALRIFGRRLRRRRAG